MAPPFVFLTVGVITCRIRIDAQVKNVSAVSRFYVRWGFFGMLLALVVVLYLALAAYLYVRQRAFIYFPDVRRPVAADTHIQGLREVVLTATDGLHLLAWYVPPAPGGSTVLYFHGNGGNIADRAQRLAMFVNAGYGVLMPEYRGYGGNPGAPSEEALLRDAQVALEFLHDQSLDDMAIVIYGESLGSGVAVAVAGGRPLQALILDAPYTSIGAIAAKQFFYMPVSWMLKDTFDSLSRITDVRAPLLVIQGARDGVIPPALGRQLFDKASEPKALWTDPEGNHSDLLERGGLKVVLDFLAQHGPH